MTTKVDLILNVINGGSEVFPDYTGYIPRVGDYITFYKRDHDGCRYAGVVKSIESRIEFKTQDSKKNATLQDVVVHIEWKDSP
jgi:hypothetical protein